MPAEPKISDISPIARIAIDAYLDGEVDEVLIAYTDFINMLAQRPAVLRLAAANDPYSRPAGSGRICQGCGYRQRRHSEL